LLYLDSFFISLVLTTLALKRKVLFSSTIFTMLATIDFFLEHNDCLFAPSHRTDCMLLRVIITVECFYTSPLSLQWSA
jgi:hypothetical protein